MPRYRNHAEQDLDLSHARWGWVDLDATSNPDTVGGSATKTVAGATVPVRYSYLRAVGGDAVINGVNRWEDGTPATLGAVTLYDGVFEPILIQDDELEIESGTVRAYYADDFYYDL